jgi:hypothetical protein
MMRQLISILIITILSVVATSFLPWWLIAVIAFLAVAFVRPPKPFLAGFFGIALFWLIAILVQDVRNEYILSQRIAEVFSLPHVSILIIVNVLLGGLIGGLAGWSAAAMRKLL